MSLGETSADGQRRRRGKALAIKNGIHFCLHLDVMARTGVQPARMAGP
jgi:hypothetical protein